MVSTANVAVESPQLHQPGPFAMAAQVFRGSAAWKQVTAATAAVVVAAVVPVPVEVAVRS